jgi:polysaccharide biosynthesis/export protein
MHRTIWVLFVFLAVDAHGILGADQTPAQSEAAAGYVLGPNDQITVSVVELPEFSGRSYRIDEDGTVSLPLLGRVRAAGLTLTQLENNLYNSLRTQVRTPHVTANVVEARTRAVSVMGAVNAPGMQQIQGTKTLFDVLAAAGGIKPEAGEQVTITRQASEGPLNLPDEQTDAADGRSTAAVKVRDVVELRDPRANIVVRAHDEISVSRGTLLYVIGNVHKPGGFTLLQGHAVSALEALSMAEGLAANASPSGARILRRTSETNAREQIPVNLKKILAGKLKDVQLSPDDILYVPDNTTRRVAAKTLETALATISGVIIWRGF